MDPSPGVPRVRLGSPAAILAVIPHLLGFTPESSLVVIGADPPGGRIRATFRYDLPDPPDASLTAAIIANASGMLIREHLTTAIVAGYGPGRLVTPLADAIRAAAPTSGLKLKDILRVEDGRYWSYLCREPSCCPADGTPFDATAHPAARVLADAGFPVLVSRAALAATIAPLTGPAAAEMAEATRRAEQEAARLMRRDGRRGIDGPGLTAVSDAITAYRAGDTITADAHAWLALALTRLPVRDDAWARMDPAYREPHRRLWTDLTRRARPGYIAPAASLLAFTAWQGGDGALANLALDQALADDSGYSMALLLRDALTAGAPPSMAVLPMTPEEVAVSYAARASGQHSGSGTAGG